MTVEWTDLSKYPFEQLERGTSIIAMDTETLGVTKATNIVCYYSWAAEDFGSGAGPPTTKEGWRFLKALCDSPRPKVFHNYKFDLAVLKRAGLEVNGKINDTLLMHALLDEHHLGFHKLKVLSRELLGKPREDDIVLQRMRRKESCLLDVPQDIVHAYAVPDAEDCLLLHCLFKPQLEEQDLWELYELSLKVERVYWKMEEHGMPVNAAAIGPAYERLVALVGHKDAPTMGTLTQKLFSQLGEQFNLRAPARLGAVLKKFFPLRLKTSSGNWQTDREALEVFSSDPKMQTLLAWKFLDAARKKFGEYQRHLTVEGKVHPSYRQTTGTGRTACMEPNLTSIPKQRGRITEVEVGDAELAEICAEAFRQVRRIFVAPEGAWLVSLDYSQVEYRCYAHYSGSERLIAEYQKPDADFHAMISLLVFEDVTKHHRHIIKIVNYGRNYGMGDPKLIRTLKIHVDDPQAVVKRYDTAVPELKATQQAIMRIGQRRGFVKDVFGRRYRLDPDKPYKLVAYLCQGTAANIKKIALVRVDDIWEGYRSRICLDIHDEIISIVWPEDAKVLGDIKIAMEDFSQFDVPIITNVSIGRNLLEMEEVTLEEAITRVGEGHV